MSEPSLESELVAWRRRLHQIPELGFEERETAEFIAGKLASFGLEVARGIGGTGVVGTLRRGGSGPSRSPVQPGPPLVGHAVVPCAAGPV